MSTLDDCNGCILNRGCPHQRYIHKGLECPCSICLFKMTCNYECYMITDFLRIAHYETSPLKRRNET
jgi:hypothetical protein